jgi:aerobic carbon-monoxide dehydrogenase small subunit
VAETQPGADRTGGAVAESTIKHDREIAVNVNGEQRRAVVEPRRTLAEFLREDCALTGTHLACEHGVCGACTVLLDGDAVRSCLIYAVQVEGADVTTVEGLSPVDGTLNPVQEALAACHGVQCGFCTPGFVVSITAFLRANPQPTNEEILDALSGNLCRCTGYQGIVAAVKSLAATKLSIA